MTVMKSGVVVGNEKVLCKLKAKWVSSAPASAGVSIHPVMHYARDGTQH